MYVAMTRNGVVHEAAYRVVGWLKKRTRTAGRARRGHHPDGMQHLLARAVWDVDAVRDHVRDYLVERLGGPEAVLVIDETGDGKKRTATVGVQRQYTGTSDKIDNAQVAFYLAYAGRHGHGLIDRELYLPACWTQDAARRAAAVVPEHAGFCDQARAGPADAAAGAGYRGAGRLGDRG